jgi:hypothetical protein
MRIFNAFFRCLGPGIAALGLPFLCCGADKPDNVVLQYHFLGATQLAENPNTAAAQKVFAQKPTILFKDLILNRLGANLAESLHFQTNKESVALLGPLLDEALRAESVASAGGPADKPINFVLAVHLDANQMQSWQKKLKTASRGPGEELRAETFSGWQWNKGANDSFWMVPAQDWMVLGRGGDLASVRSDYLQQIQKTGRPVPALDFNCFEADVDWPRLAGWVPLYSCPLKLGRTQIAINLDQGNFHMTCQVTYPEAIEWQSRPMNIPTDLVREPLTSFAMGQDVQPFLKSDEFFPRFGSDPFSDQFYFWSMGEMAFESYVVWPANDPSNIMNTLSGQGLDELNPKLQALNGTDLTWDPLHTQILWSKLQLTAPFLKPMAESNGQFLVAGLFPLVQGKGPAPQALWEQFKDRTDLVYYNWELTGPRVRHLLTVSQVLPILQMLGVGPKEPPGVKPAFTPETVFLMNAQEVWLSSLSSFLGNTATEVTKTGPNELTITRGSPFVFDSLELLLLCHCLSGTPAGTLDWNLLPQAKMSGPGMPRH